jgi:hypothetical protein
MNVPDKLLHYNGICVRRTEHASVRMILQEFGSQQKLGQGSLTTLREALNQRRSR